MTAKTDSQKLRITTGSSPTAFLPGKWSRERSALAFRIAARLELACPSGWYVGVDAAGGQVWLESATDSADDLGARLTALKTACGQEGVS